MGAKYTSHNETQEPNLHGEVVSDFLLRQLSERGLCPPRALNLSRLKVRLTGHSDDADLDRLLRHAPLEALLQRQQCRMDGVLEADIVVVPSATYNGQYRVRPAATAGDRLAHRFSRKVFAFTMFLPIALAFQAQ